MREAGLQQARDDQIGIRDYGGEGGQAAADEC